MISFAHMFKDHNGNPVLNGAMGADKITVDKANEPLEVYSYSSTH